jgi:hypothetical protein
VADAVGSGVVVLGVADVSDVAGGSGGSGEEEQGPHAAKRPRREAGGGARGAVLAALGLFAEWA